MASESSWSPPPIPEAVRSAPGFPGEEAYDAAMFLADCAARVGRVDSDVRKQCPFLLQVSYPIPLMLKQFLSFFLSFFSFSFIHSCIYFLLV